MKNKVVKIKKDYYKAMKQMTDKQIAEFIKSVCDYVYEGKPMITKDSFLKGVFMYVQREALSASVDIVVITEQKEVGKVG